MRLSGQPCDKRRVDQRIEPALLAHDAADDVAEERRFGRQILRALDLAAEPMALELGEDLVQAGAGDVHLVERLHGGEPRRAAPVGLALVFGAPDGPSPIGVSRRLSRTRASAALAAPPPLSPSSGRARAPGLRLGIDGEDAVADRQLAAHAR